jgi:hypothetical protein
MVASIVMCSLFATYFLVTGLRALVSGRMTVVNPENRRASPGVVGALLWRMRPPARPDAPTGLHVEATGAEARGRAILNIVLGTAFVAALIASIVMR